VSIIEEFREKVRNKVGEVMKLLTDLDEVRNTLHELEKTESRLRNELTEIYEKADDILDMEIKHEPTEPK
jgi:uncharacterized membrane protein